MFALKTLLSIFFSNVTNVLITFFSSSFKHRFGHRFSAATLLYHPGLDRGLDTYLCLKRISSDMKPVRNLASSLSGAVCTRPIVLANTDK